MPNMREYHIAGFYLNGTQAAFHVAKTRGSAANWAWSYAYRAFEGDGTRDTIAAHEALAAVDAWDGEQPLKIYIRDSLAVLAERVA